MTIPSEPFSRKEQYLSKIAGDDHGIPAEPFSREEQYLDAIAKNGGGGGGASGFETLELVINPDDNTVSTTKTAREIIALYTSGKCFASSLTLDPDPESLICVQIFYGTLIYFGEEDGYFLAGFTHSPESIVRLEFSAADLDSVFTASLPN